MDVVQNKKLLYIYVSLSKDTHGSKILCIGSWMYTYG